LLLVCAIVETLYSRAHILPRVLLGIN